MTYDDWKCRDLEDERVKRVNRPAYAICRNCFKPTDVGRVFCVHCEKEKPCATK